MKPRVSKPAIAASRSSSASGFDAFAKDFVTKALHRSNVAPFEVTDCVSLLIDDCCCIESSARCEHGAVSRPENCWLGIHVALGRSLMDVVKSIIISSLSKSDSDPLKESVIGSAFGIMVCAAAAGSVAHSDHCDCPRANGDLAIGTLSLFVLAAASGGLLILASS